MAVPKKKTSKPKTRTRRSHRALRTPGLSSCLQCGATRKPHRACGECGFYNGRQVLVIEKETEE